MRLSGSAVDVVERAYDLEASLPAWLEGVRSAADGAFKGQLHTTAFVFRASVDGSFSPVHVLGPPELRESFRLFHELARPEIIRGIYLSGPVPSLCGILPNPMDEAVYTAAALPFGFEEMWGVIGVDPSGLGCALAFPNRRRSRLSRATRLALERIAAHLASAFRLREGLSERADAVHGSDAVLAPDGAVLHAERDARACEARAALRDAARRMDSARLKAQRRNESGLALWRALVAGRWSLVETFESDGRRLLVARRNDPTSRQSRVLNELERKVVALLAVGRSLKLCAYELGRAESTIHAAMASATSKLGVRSRAQLVELHGALVTQHDAAPKAGKSGAKSCD